MITKFLKENWFKVIVIGILVGALWNHPYSYYQFLRWITAISSAYLAYKYAEIEKFGWVWMFIAMTILFNPIMPFYLSKEMWQKLDLAGAIIFFVSMFIKRSFVDFGPQIRYYSRVKFFT